MPTEKQRLAPRNPKSARAAQPAKPVHNHDEDANEGHATTWDHKEYFEKEIRPLAAKIFDLCRAKGIPFVSGYAVSHDPDAGTTGVVTNQVVVNGKLPEPLHSAARALAARSEGHPLESLLRALSRAR